MLENANCTKCELCKLRKNVINGVGSATPKVVFVGEAPGLEADAKCNALLGPAGLQLQKLLAQAQISLQDIFITHVVRCVPRAPYPINVRPPTKEEAAICFPYLDQELKTLQPALIVPMGNVALRAILKQKAANITKHRGVETWSEEYNCKILPVFNPSSLLKAPKYENITNEDFKRIKLSYETKELLNVNQSGSYKVIQTLPELDTLLEALKASKAYAFDIETSGLNCRRDKVLCVAFTWQAGSGVTVPLQRYIPISEKRTVLKVKKKRKTVNGVVEVTEIQVPEVEDFVIDTYEDYWGSEQNIVLEKLREIFALPCIRIAHNGKFDSSFLINANIPVKSLDFDTMLAHHLLDENAQNMHGLKECAWVYTSMGGYEKPLDDWFKERGITDKDRNYAHLPPELLYTYNAKDTDVAFQLYEKFVPMLEADKLTNFFQKLIMPLSRTLLQAEMNGLCVDVAYLQVLKAQLIEDTTKLETEIKKSTGNININSTKQLGAFLFDTLKLRSAKVTKAGKMSTDEEALTLLAEQHAVPKLLLEYRKLEKLLNTYVLGLEERLDEDRKIHTSFLIHGTATGRLASQNPNMQNIPSDDTRVKDMFIPTPGWKFIEADYGQAEFRFWANYSKDPQMIKDIIAATNGTGPDIHILTAAQVRGIPVDQVMPEMRKQAKGVVFGLMYGRSAMSVAAEYNIPEEEANRIIRAFFGKYPVAKMWLDEVVRTARVYKQVRNYFGRLRRLPGINSEDQKVRAEAERQALNSPIQAAASDLNCNATNRIRLAFGDQGFRGQLLLLVHDSLLYEVPAEEVEQSLNIIKMEMERPVLDMSAPMQAEFKLGSRWGSMVKLESKSDGWYIKREVDGKKILEKYIQGVTNV